MQLTDLDGREKYRILQVSYSASAADIKKVGCSVGFELPTAQVHTWGADTVRVGGYHLSCCRHTGSLQGSATQTKAATLPALPEYRTHSRHCPHGRAERCMMSGQGRSGTDMFASTVSRQATAPILYIPAIWCQSNLKPSSDGW